MTTLSMAVVMMIAGLQSAETPASKIAETARTAFQANRSSMPYGKIVYDYSLGRADSIEAAEAGDWEHYTAKSEFVYNKEMIKYTRVFGEMDMVRQLGGVDTNRTGLALSSMRIVTNGKVTLFDVMHPSGDQSDETMHHMSQINPGVESLYHEVVVPLSLGLPAEYVLTDHVLKQAIEGVDCKITKVEEHKDDKDNNVIKFWISADGAEIEIWVDIDRGGIPLRHWSKDARSGVVYEARYDDLREVMEGVWLPWRYTSYNQGVVHQVVVRDADFKAPPASAEFRLDYPEPQILVDVARGLRYKARRTWDLARLPSASSADAKAIDLGDHSTIPTMPGPQASRPGWVWYLAAFSLLMAVVAFVVWRRRRA